MFTNSFLKNNLFKFPKFISRLFLKYEELIFQFTHDILLLYSLVIFNVSEKCYEIGFRDHKSDGDDDVWWVKLIP